jgi:hypothetical protein
MSSYYTVGVRLLNSHRKLMFTELLSALVINGLKLKSVLHVQYNTNEIKQPSDQVVTIGIQRSRRKYYTNRRKDSADYLTTPPFPFITKMCEGVRIKA